PSPRASPPGSRVTQTDSPSASRRARRSVICVVLPAPSTPSKVMKSPGARSAIRVPRKARPGSPPEVGTGPDVSVPACRAIRFRLYCRRRSGRLSSGERRPRPKGARRERKPGRDVVDCKRPERERTARGRAGEPVFMTVRAYLYDAEGRDREAPLDEAAANL